VAVGEATSLAFTTLPLLIGVIGETLLEQETAKTINPQTKIKNKIIFFIKLRQNTFKQYSKSIFK
jgi:hypothetical protein